MKKIRENMKRYFDKVDDRWRALPLRKQYKYLLYCFLGYLILTIAIILKVWYDTGKANYNLSIEHIENPVVKKKESAIPLQDSMLKIIKNRRDERK
ncbi:nitrogen regulatory IIA protein [Flavobacterium sp. L1I52]|uniref:Nitrogen regulatory IIA protein n=1 Tax=Flavobacterium pokkalii TaxID=1940408 RepID=A0ABR7UQ81_9FLAO|nr:nitrogen regulatory IIA protein [Flavobacterium pokkalii]MBD0724798.1 nitrogen regulatory IIA protein [Flavobacterium pokkalii]